MDMVNEKYSRKNLINKSWRQCSNLLKQNGKAYAALSSLTKRSSWSCNSTSSCKRKKNKVVGRVAPAGFFSVCVGPEKQRFAVKTEFANHRLFKLLLADSALEYGYKNDGPLLLPCDVDSFCNVMIEIEGDIVEDKISSNRLCLMRAFFVAARPRHSEFRINGLCSLQQKRSLATTKSCHEKSIFLA